MQALHATFRGGAAASSKVPFDEDDDVAAASPPKQPQKPTSRSRKQHSNTLLKMITAASAGKHGCTWTHVLQYIQANTILDDRTTPPYIPNFDHPLGHKRRANAKLFAELQHENTILAALSHAAPVRILAAILYLHPERLGIPDTTGRLPLHLACRYPPNDALFTAMRLLVQANPSALIHTDPHGRTALHHVLLYHTGYRTVETIQLFLQHPGIIRLLKNNSKITTLADENLCLPLHYAACFGAKHSVLQRLMEHAPATKHAVDRLGRTILHWYLGNYDTNAAGEPTEPQRNKWDIPTVRLLSTSRVARTVDAQEQTVLHAACRSIAMDCAPDTTIASQVIQVLLDTHAGQLTLQDANGQTPVMVYLDTLLERQLQSKDIVIRADVLELLQKNPNVAGMERNDGKLPLHLAVALASPTELIGTWLDLHPTGLLHVDEHMRVAMHEAFLYPQTAKLQTADTIDLLLQQSCETNSVKVDGRLAMKMEDTDGQYAIHYACRHGASADVIQTILTRYPKAALLLNPNDDLPIQCLLREDTLRDPSSIRESIKAMLPPLLAAPHALHTEDSRYGMMPLHIMVYFQAANYTELLKLLEACPQAADHYAKAILGEDGPQTASPLDLHEMNQQRMDISEWHLIRELLFSFSPKLESHRHRQELLDRCVAIIVDDVTGKKSSHYLHMNDETGIDHLELTHTVSAMEAQVNTKKFLKTQSYLAKRQLTNDSNGSKNGKANKSSSTRRSFRPPRLPHLSFSSSEDTNTKASRSINSRTTGSGNSIYDDESTGLDDYDTQSHIDEDDEDDESSYGSGDTSFSETEEDPTETEGVTTLDGDTEGEFTTGSGTYLSEEGYRTDSVSHSPSHGQSSFEHDSFIDDMGVFARKAEALDQSGRISAEMIHKKSTDSSVPNVLKTPRRGNQLHRRTFCRPSFMSEVGMRLWTFFMLYRDPKNPSDNYSQQIGEIVDAIEYDMVELLVTHPIPPYASSYLDAEHLTDELCFRDAACPKCREIVQKTCFFMGLYDFRNDEDVLVHRGWNCQSLDVKAFEWIFTTEEETEAKSPGVAEQTIWSSGELPPEVGLTYRTAKRPVLIRFLTSKEQYESEIARQNLPDDENCSFLSIIAHFNAFGVDRKVDVMYESQIHDPQFNKIPTRKLGSDSVELDQFSYAVVYEWPTHGTLQDYSCRFGLDDPQEIRRLAVQLAKGLSSMHEIDYYGINITEKNVAMLEEAKQRWGFMSMAMASKSGSFAGGIDDKGIAHFSMDSLPPDMFEELSPRELQQYEKYWSSIRERFHVNIDDRLTKPLINDATGASWVVKCHFIPLTTSGDDFVLPYQLQTLSAYHDVWSFGRLLLELLSGRRVQRRDVRFGNLTDHFDILFNAEPSVLNLISDPVAQDLLLKCLSSPRGDFALSDILEHPYLSGCLSPKISESLSFKTASFSRDIAQRHKASAQQRSKERSGRIVNCWDLAILEKFFLSPSSLMAHRFDSICPCAVVLLPDPTEQSNSCARLGSAVLSFIKSCFFASVMQQAISENAKEEFACQWPPSTAMRVLDLTSKDFADIQQRMEDFATRHVEAYRSDPLSIAARIAKDRLADVVSCYKELHIGFVDEFTGRRSGPTIEVPQAEMSALLMSALPLFVLTCVYSMGLSKDLSSIGVLLRCSSVPDSWISAAAGVPCELSETMMVNITQALEEYFGGIDVHAWERFCLDRDPLLRRMESSSGGSIWTTEELEEGGSMRDIVREFQRLKSNGATVVPLS